MFLVGPYSFAPGTMFAAAQRLGLASGLVVCLDAGDANSYDGTSQTWTDTSGNSNNFYRGTGSGSDTFDPTFHGSAGNQSSNEYFQNDGGDAFWQTSSQTFMNTWHKDNATFTVASWCYMPSTGTTPSLGFFRNWRDNTDLGIGTAVAATVPFVSMVNASGTGTGQIFGPSGTLTLQDQWQFVVISFSEGSGASFVLVNSTVGVFTSDTFSSPSASSAPNGVAVMGVPDAAGTNLETTGVQGANGQRINSLMAWSRALSQSEATSLYNATKGKFGL